LAFLAYSSWHFGTEQESEPLSPRKAAASFAKGALPIAAACHWHPDQVAAIFRAMLGSTELSSFPQQLTHSAAALLWAFIVVAGLGASTDPGRTRRGIRILPVCLIALELLLFWRCDPVLAFAIYFCCWHTPEHLVSSSRDDRGVYSVPIMIRNLRAGVFPWLVSLAGLALMLAFRPHSFVMYVSAIFIFLSALTVPHMALNEVSRLTRLTSQCQ
jgi:Brp/Blh family beta-carotene 15,15'-monooxygenase